MTQAPAEQTSPTPHEVPSTLDPTALHVPGCEGEVQVVAPRLHAFEGSHAAPGVQPAATHEPLLHTLPPPHVVPSGLLLVTMQLASESAVGHEVMPLTQALLGWHG